IRPPSPPRVVFRRREASWRAMLRAVLLLIAASLAVPAGAARAPHVVIVLVDGLDASLVGEALSPTIWALARGREGPATFYPHATAVLPAVTHTHHAAILTRTHASAHGIAANEFPDRGDGATPISSERADLLEVETLFTVGEAERPALVTAAFFGKARLTGLFGASRGRQRRPDLLWGDAESESEP